MPKARLVLGIAGGCAAVLVASVPFWGHGTWPTDTMSSLVIPLTLAAAAVAGVLLPKRAHWAWAAPAVAVLLLAISLGATSARALRGEGEAGLSVLILNAWSENPTPQKVADVLARENADIVCLIECPADLVTLEAAGGGVFAAYPVRERRWPEAPRSGWTFLLSKFEASPLEILDAPWLAEQNPFPIAARVRAPGGDLAVMALQAASPRSVDRWYAGNVTAQRAAVVARAAGTMGLPVVAGGDLNSAPTGGREALLEEGGLRRAKPRLAGGTYPAWLPGPLRVAIDDAWISGDLKVRSWRTVGGTGSDHLGVRVDLVRAR